MKKIPFKFHGRQQMALNVVCCVVVAIAITGTIYASGGFTTDGSCPGGTIWNNGISCVSDGSAIKAKSGDGYGIGTSCYQREYTPGTWIACGHSMSPSRVGAEVPE